MEIASPAKINLYLEVVGKRPDGYHDLRTLMCPVGLFDTVRIRIGGDRIRLGCTAPGVPEDESNLAWKAAAVFGRAMVDRGLSPPPGVAIDLEKRIPAGGGLGGGSSNAASVLMGLNRAMNEPFGAADLAHLASGLGADVPFFLLQTPALATGIGDRLTPVRTLVPHPVLIVDPGISISTASVYSDLNLGLTKCGKRHKKFAFRARNFEAVHHLCNDLEAVVFPRHPALAVIKTELVGNGALGALMAGSGACVFGLFADIDDARKACQRLSRRHGWRIFQADMIV